MIQIIYYSLLQFLINYFFLDYAFSLIPNFMENWNILILKL
jgi:hypothetical protein